MNVVDFEEAVRENRTWVAIIGDAEFVKFTVPEEVNGELYENTQHNAIWIYMSAMKRFNYVPYTRMMNLDDVQPREIIDLIPIVDFDPVLLEV
jgi:hypothetical protein